MRGFAGSTIIAAPRRGKCRSRSRRVDPCVRLHLSPVRGQLVRSASDGIRVFVVLPSKIFLEAGGVNQIQAPACAAEQRRECEHADSKRDDCLRKFTNHEGVAMRKQINPSIKAYLLRSALILLSVIAICVIPFALAQSRGHGTDDRIAANNTDRSQLPSANGNLPQQNILSGVPSQSGAVTHETRVGEQAGLQRFTEFQNGITPPVETVSSASPTRSTFMATWDNMGDAKGYFLDVSTDDSFSSYVDGYHGLDVGNVNGQVVTGLKPGTTYYYRVRPYTAAGSWRVLECHRGYDTGCRRSNY